ncbi:hypothetical protein Tsubulata_006935 [Turnera subulata]|uniref:Late embryogenesis abundant protein At5g17165-like n=1 Tax=Turnera subulata TaxID=218843 RepID=A0A9Q0JN23_9ROSI|nr:hypothetical protein Tsubulata_006935 [Turnera subulata]
MAANNKSVQGVVTNFGKRLLNQIWIAPSPPPYSTSLRRAAAAAAHTSAYDKNLDEEVRPSVVPDEIIEAQADKYWAPHPQTGVFGPATTDQQQQQHPAAAAGDAAGKGSSSSSSVLEEKAWFRPTSLEDLDKPHHP